MPAGRSGSVVHLTIDSLVAHPLDAQARYRKLYVVWGTRFATVTDLGDVFLAEVVLALLGSLPSR